MNFKKFVLKILRVILMWIIFGQMKNHTKIFGFTTFHIKIMQFHTYAVSEKIPFSTKTRLTLLISAFFEKIWHF